MKKNFNLKKRVIIGLFLLGTIFLFYCVNYLVYANFTFNGTLYNVEDDADGGGGWSSHSQSFYCEENDRWYILYPVDSSVNYFVGYYSFTDSGNLTTWNNGGAITGLLVQTVQNFPKRTSLLSWTYDNNNSLGHIVYVDTVATTLNYKNFTIDVDGSIIGGSVKILPPSFCYYGVVDICLDPNGIPMISVFTYTGADHFACGYICDSSDGYNEEWTLTYFDPYPTQTYGSIMGIPLGESTLLIVAQSLTAQSPLRAFKIENGVTSNSSGQGTIFSDNSVHFSNSGVSYNYNVYGFMGCSWNSTHGTIQYCDYSTHNPFIFSFDFDTLTRDIEYQIGTEGESSYWGIWNGVTVNNEEFFSVTLWYATGSTYSSLVANENFYNSQVWNSTQIVLDEFEDEYGWHYIGTCTSRFTDTNNNTLVLTHLDGVFDGVAVTFITCNGFIEEGNGNGNGLEDPFDWSGIKWILALIVAIIIFSFAVYIKGGRR